MAEAENNLKESTFFNDKNEAILKDLFNNALTPCLLLLKAIWFAVPNLILYSLLSFLYLHIYSAIGFEKTIIILIVGVIVFALRASKRE